MSNTCIGLFGTCGDSTFRKDLFIPAYEELGLIDGQDFFNPQVEDWDPSLAQIEANHLATDRIVLFPITGETYATASLAECGFSILNTVTSDDRRFVVIMIDQYLDPALMDDIERAKDSLRARALVLAHINKLNLPSVYVVQSLEEMLDLSIKLYNASKQLEEFDQFSSTN